MEEFFRPKEVLTAREKKSMALGNSSPPCGLGETTDAMAVIHGIVGCFIGTPRWNWNRIEREESSSDKNSSW
jgi:hypothetical protein